MNHAEPYFSPLAPSGLFLLPPDDGYDPFDLPEGDTSEEASCAPIEMPEPSGLVQLYDFQQCAVDAILREHENVVGTLCVSATGTGKCFGKDTPVLMYDGTIKEVQDVKKGDLLMGPDSKPRKVLGCTCGRGTLYRVTPKKGDPYVVNGEHVLSLKMTGEKRPRSGSVVNISVNDYLKQNRTFKHVAKGYRVGVDFPQEDNLLSFKGLLHDVLLDPYFLGLWLGDDHSYSQSITSFARETIAFLEGYAAALDLTLTVTQSKGVDHNYNIAGVKGKANEVLNALRFYGLLQNKHIPHCYKTADRKTRLKVLAGLIDSDGSLDAGGYDLVFKVRAIADDAAFVARSLGFAAYVKPCRKTCCNNGVEGEYFRLFISGDVQEIPVLIARKKAAPRQQKKDVLMTGITVEPIGDGQYFGFEVDGDHLFLLGDFTVTHNSIMMAELIRRYVAAGHKVLILVHRDELIRQLARSMGRVGLPVLIEKAGEKALAGFGTLADVVCASVQTMQRERLAQWPQDSFGLIVVDEAHHIQAESYLKILRHFGWRQQRAHSPYLAGFTATADRLDKKNVGAVFDSLAFEYNLRQAVQEGRLVKPVSITLDTDPPIDLRELRTTAGDFNAGDLEQVIAASLNQIVNAIADDGRLGSRKAIGFTPDINSARAMAAALSKVGITADFVSGACKNREEKLKAHQRGDYQVLVNCMLATEGYDDPEIAAVLLCRPTKSRGLLSQMVGRGTRLAPNKKDCLLIDFNYLTREHDLAAGVDLFDDNTVSDEVLAIAREITDNESGGDLEDALSRAETINAERVKERIRRQRIPMKAGSFDPLGIAEFFDIPVHKEAYDWQNVRVASDRQLGALQKLGVAVTPDLPFVHAKKMLDVLISRSQHGWTTMRQINALMESGIDPDTARSMRKTEAVSFLDQNPLPPSDKQKKMLRWKGVPDAEIVGMTRKDASARIDALMKQQSP